MDPSVTRQRKKTVLAISVYAVLFLVLLLITNVGHFNKWASSVLALFRPVLIGLGLAYLLNPFFRFFERTLFSKINPFGLRRTISLIFTYLTLFAIIWVLIMLIVPQLVSSITDFLSNSNKLLSNAVNSINEMIGSVNEILPLKEDGTGQIAYIRAEVLGEGIANMLNSIKVDGEFLMRFLNAETLGAVFNVLGGVVSLVGDVLFGLFISLYLLNSKEKRYAQVMRLRRAMFSDQTNEVITKICTTADKSFGGFLKGKIFDSCVVGLLVYIAISIIGVPYAVLIAAIIAITDIVPVIGPFIGVIPSAVIILLTDYTMVIPFLICILVIQQIDGNILAPKILGENTGVSSLSVIIAITTLGSLWGLAGMVLGVPLFATVLELTSDWLDNRLKKKGLSTATDDYYTPELAADEAPVEKNVFKRMQERIAQRRQAVTVGGNGVLSPFERSKLETYELAKKHELFSKKDDDSLMEFATEEAVIAEEVEQLIEEEIARIEEEEALRMEEELIEMQASEAPIEEVPSESTEIEVTEDASDVANVAEIEQDTAPASPLTDNATASVEQEKPSQTCDTSERAD